MSKVQERILCEELQQFIVKAERHSTSIGLQSYINEVKQILLKHIEFEEGQLK